MCGIVGILGHREAANLAYLGLYALQHRGQESVGIVSSDGSRYYQRKRSGLVADAFRQSTFAKLKGESAVGHVRYSTAGDSNRENIQPMYFNGPFGEMALAHNGNLVNTRELKAELESSGAIFRSSSDTEIFAHLMARGEGDLIQRMESSLRQVRGAYSLVFSSHELLVGVRDPYGFRPLSIGKYKGATILASETCAFDLVGAEYVRDVKPGEMVIIHRDQSIESKIFSKPQSLSRCVFEHIYFARPDSQVFDQAVYDVRKKMGRVLAKEHPVEADLLMPVPDSGIAAALGYSEESGLPFDLGLIRNHYVHRTFIEPDENIRHFGVRVKLNPMRKLLSGKRVVILDDSIVRGTTSRKIVQMLREAGVSEVHFRVSSPPIVAPCYFGIDTPTKQELLAAKQSVTEMQEYLKVDSLGFLSKEGMLSALDEKKTYCTSCFTGEYPMQVEEPLRQAV